MVILSIQIWTCMGKLPPISRLAIAGCYTQFTHDSPKVWTQSQEPLGSQIYLKSGTRESFCYHKTVLFIKSYEVIVKKKCCPTILYFYIEWCRMYSTKLYVDSKVKPSYVHPAMKAFLLDSLLIRLWPCSRCPVRIWGAAWSQLSVFSRSEEADVVFEMREASSFERLVGGEKDPSVFSLKWVLIIILRGSSIAGILGFSSHEFGLLLLIISTDSYYNCSLVDAILPFYNIRLFLLF